MLVSLILFILFIILGLLENESHQRNLRKVPLRILVNGTRGKTTTSRLLVASLNAKGIRTLGRTTGSEAETIYPDGTVEPFVRKKKASILEMRTIFQKAVEVKAECVVVECMALQPENQQTMARVLVRPTHVLMTNTFIDHVAEMGPSIEETAYALGLSVPKGAQLYTIDSYYNHLDCTVHHITAGEEAVPDFPIPVHRENYALAKALLLDLGVTEEDIRKGASTMKPDIGLLKAMTAPKGAVLLPTFSVNDLTVMGETVRNALAQYPGRRTWILYNNRADREYRISLMDQVLKTYREQLSGVIVIGDYTWKVKRHFSRTITSEAMEPEELYKRISEGKEDELYIGLGNIKGKGEKLISFFLKENT